MDLRGKAVKIAVPKNKVPLRRKLIKVAAPLLLLLLLCCAAAKVVSLI